MAGPPANRVCQSYGSAPSRPRERACVSRAADDPPESAPPAECTRKGRPDPGTVRASHPPAESLRESESPPLRPGELFQQTANLFSDSVWATLCRRIFFEGLTDSV